MRNASDAIRVSLRREEIAVVFGSRQERKAGEDSLPVLASLRVILSPFAAKRLLASLVKCLGEYEAAYGPVGEAVKPEGRIAPPVLHPPAFRLIHSTRTAVQLLELLERLGAGAQFERSFKLLDKTLLANRFLLAVDKSQIAGQPEARVLDLCQRLGMPPGGLAVFREHLPEADVVGFALEEDESACTVKAYVEFRRRYKEAMREPRDRSYSYVSHLGLKWDASDPARNVLGEYVCFPTLTADDMLERLCGRYYPSDSEGPFAAVRDILALAMGRVGRDKFLYLEATEEATPRASFDINVYGANLKMREVRDPLAGLFRHYTIPEEKFRELYETMKDGTLGHLAGGTDRQGRTFLTVYFEE